MKGNPNERETSSYYRGAVLGLRFLEAQKPTGRRFGAEADARWASFRGDLTTADRIDLMIRDANAQWPGALGARTTFGLRAVAEDEPFGAGHQPLDPVDAEELWRAQLAAPAPADLPSLLSAVAQAWSLRIEDHPAGAIGAADKLLVVGPSAIASVIRGFQASRDLDWSDQVVIVATPPGHRQLAALGGALLGATKPTQLLSNQDNFSGRGFRRVASPDADPDDLARAKAWAP